MNFNHGGNLGQFAKINNYNPNDIVDLSSNINFIKPTIDLGKCDIGTYPTYEKLIEVTTNYYNVKDEQIEFFNGASSAIFSLMRQLKNQNCTLYSPIYLEYKKSVLLNKKKITLIDRFNQLDATVEENSLVVFVNPSTPDGKYYDLETLFLKWCSKNCTIIIDESFLEFTTKKSAISLLSKYDKLYIVKSMTKFFSCAGVRFGMVISSKENIAKLKQEEPLWKISAFDSQFITNILEDKNFYLQTIKENTKAKEYLQKILSESNIIKKIYESDANFFLVELVDISAKEFQEKLIPFGIMIRDCSNFDFLNEKFARIAVKSMVDLQRFKKALDVF